MASKEVPIASRQIRPLPPRNENLSFSITNSVAADILRYTLNNTDPTTLHGSLYRILKILHPSEQAQLVALLKAGHVINEREVAAGTDTTQRHCARCHTTYLERSNMPGVCQIPHSKPEIVPSAVQVAGAPNGMVTSTSDPTNPEGYDLIYRCCGLKAKPTANVGLCVKERHTTRPANVRFNSINVKPCEVNGCIGYHRGTMLAGQAPETSTAGADVNQGPAMKPSN